MALEVGKSYRLYAKDGNKRYAPIDWSTGATVGNLIYATIFECESDTKKATMEEVLADLHVDNNNVKFEFREVKGW